MEAPFLFRIWIVLVLFMIGLAFSRGSGIVVLNSSITVKGKEVWTSSNGTFALGFHSVSPRRYILGIWYARFGTEENRTFVWMANRDQPVGENGFFNLGQDGNLQLGEGQSTVWMAETTGLSVESGEMQESGNFVVYNFDRNVVWQSFASPTDTLLPGQQLSQSLNLTSKNSSTDMSRGHYWLKMTQKPESLKIALNYNAPYESYNFSYWSGPEVDHNQGPAVAYLDNSGNLLMRYGSSTNRTVYVYRNSREDLSERVLRRLVVDHDGNLKLFKWDPHSDYGWIVEWSAVQNPCSIAGKCGNGICKLDYNGKPQCSCPPGLNAVNQNSPFFGCMPSKHLMHCGDKENGSSRVTTTVLQQTNYFSGSSIISSYNKVFSSAACFDICLHNCSCIASVFGPYNGKPQCLTLKTLLFGGMQDPRYTLLVKVVDKKSSVDNQSVNGSKNSRRQGQSQLKAIILGSVLGSVFLVCVFGLFCTRTIFINRRKGHLDASIFVPGAPVKFSFGDLQVATSNFREMLGTGGFGTVFKGTLSDGTLIAVKKLERTLPHGEKEFKTEVSTIGAIHHMNLVRLWGFCSEGSHRLLVYECLSNGSLDRWLFRSQESVLDWNTRYNIALGTAQGIAYFHEQCRDKIIHCDIKPENILLDDNFCSKVSDFGLAKLMGREHSHVITMVRGTRGYLAPEWITNRPITVKADVYSYGMVLLEIISGRRNLDMSLGAESFFFPGWAFQEMTRGNASKVIDKRLCGEFNEAQLLRALRIAFWCIQDDVGLRPHMGLVVKILEGSLDVKDPPMPQSVVEMVEEGLPNIYGSMRKDLISTDCSTSLTKTGSQSIHRVLSDQSIHRVLSDATYDFSSMSMPR